MLLKISQNSQESTCARVSFLIKLQAWGMHRCFPVNFAKFSRTPFSIEHLRWLLLTIWRASKKEHLFYGKTTSGFFWSSLLLLLITLIFVFYSNSKSFKELKSSISFSLKWISSVLFSFFFFKSNRPEVFCKKGVLRNLAKFTGKHLSQRLFIKSGCFCFFYVFSVFLSFVSFFLVARRC